jgi:hypothetical protein
MLNLNVIFGTSLVLGVVRIAKNNADAYKFVALLKF